MEEKRIHRKPPSIKARVLLLLAGGLLTTLTVLLFDHLLANDLIKEETAYQYQTLLDERVRALENSLVSDTNAMAIFANTNTYIDRLYHITDTDNSYFTSLHAKQDLERVVMSPLTEVAFFIRETESTTYYGIAKFTSLSAFENRDLEKYIKGAATDAISTGNRWRLFQAGDNWFFIYGFATKECHFGLCLRAEHLLDSLGLNTDDGYGAAVISDNGEVINTSKHSFSEPKGKGFFANGNTCAYRNNSNVVIFADSKSLNRPIYYVRENAFSSNMEQISFLLRITSFLIAIVYFTISVSSYYSIRKPISELQARICEIRDGKLQSSMEIRPNTPGEFVETYHVFHEMLQEIQSLKISSYEKELEKQKFEIQFLSMQIEPHFYLNSMKYLYALVQRKQYSRVQQILLELSKYFRYLTYDSQKLVEAAKEIDHVESYLMIATSGLQSSPQITFSIQPQAETLLVPKLFVQTFVENAVKYAAQDDGSLEVHISISVIEGDAPFLSMTVRDNGKGFSKKYLDEVLEKGFQLSEEHVGLSNLYHRLILLYGDQIYMNISNQNEGGAMAEVIIPAFTEQPEESSK